MPASDGFTRTALEAAQKNGDQSGKVFLVTGAYSGIGVETVKALLAVGGRVIVAGRDPAVMKDFVETALIKEGGYDPAQVDGTCPPLDLGDLKSVQNFARSVLAKYEKLDCLINNAGVMMTPAGVTKDGYETQIGINVVGHYLLAKTLEPITSRQVWVSSKAHEMSGAKRFDFDYFTNFTVASSKYSSMLQYQQSKLGDILLAKEFPKRNPKLEAVSLHPGVINTNLGRHLPWFAVLVFKFLLAVRLFLRSKTVEQGAATTVTCATLPSSELAVGAYYDDCDVGTEHDCAKNADDAKRLYDLCDEITKKFQ
jgi:retinol dehydrogenase 12